MCILNKTSNNIWSSPTDTVLNMKRAFRWAFYEYLEYFLIYFTHWTLNTLSNNSDC